MDDPAVAGTLAIGRGIALFVGRRVSTPMHQHRAVQLVVSARSTFELDRDGRTRVEDVALVPSGAPHALRASAAVAILLVESDGPRGRRLDALAKTSLTAAMSRLVRAVGLPASTPADLARAASAWLDALDPHASPRMPASEEVARVLSVVEGAAQRGEPLGLVDVARAVSLSPTRVTHRVSHELGLPYRALVRWTRMRFAIRATRAGKSLTEAALGAGFADASHLSRTFRAALGISPSRLLERVALLELEIDRVVQASPTRIP